MVLSGAAIFSVKGQIISIISLGLFISEEALIITVIFFASGMATLAFKALLLSGVFSSIAHTTVGAVLLTLSNIPLWNTSSTQYFL